MTDCLHSSNTLSRLLLFCILPLTSFSSYAAGLTQAETFALNELKHSGSVDFRQSGLSNPVISADCLRQFLIGANTSAAIKSNGISITFATISGTLEVTHANIPFALRFDSCHFDDGIEFEYDTFNQDLSLTKSWVGTPGRPTSADFIGTKVEGTLDLDGTTFFSAVNFTYAEIGSEFLSDDVRYESTETTDFDSIRTKAPVFFRRDYFAGKLYLADSTLFALHIEGPPTGSESAVDRHLDLRIDQAHISHGFELKDVIITDLQAGFLDVQGPMEFTHVIPESRADLRHAHFQSLTIAGFDPWLRTGSSNAFKLEGLTFDGIEVPDSYVDPPAMKMLDLLNSPRCPYSPQPYLELETFLREHGNPEKADLTYIDMRRREREQLAPWKRPFDWLLYMLVGYGRYPWRAGICALGFVLLGAVFFGRDRMEHDSNDTDNWYNRFWYSLDLLSPIDLGISKKWRARKSALRNYAQVQRILGWVLIPLFAAAITGIIK
jgi:hypothetical protein